MFCRRENSNLYLRESVNDGGRDLILGHFSADYFGMVTFIRKFLKLFLLSLTMHKKTQEGKALLKIPAETKISKKLPVFYNPVMKSNRDVAVALLNAVNDKNLRICLPLAGTGVRGIRFLLELNKGKIKEIFFNDYSENAFKLIKENLRLNKIKKAGVSCKDANIFLLESTGFDCIDVDPFGTPNPFLDSAIKRIARNGILAVTATDTSALAGTYPSACLRKYWAKPSRDELMHETGLRILIRKIQLIGAQYEKALMPVFSHSTEHYMRVYLRCEKGKKKADEILEKHGLLNSTGPLWLGNLWDKKLAKKMAKTGIPLLKTIGEEAQIDTLGFYNIHKICKRLKVKIPKTDFLIKAIRKKGFKAARTHFTEKGIRSDVSFRGLVSLVKEGYYKL